MFVVYYVGLHKGKIMRIAFSLAMAFCLISFNTISEEFPLIDNDTANAISKEISGVSAKRHLDQVTLYHRTRASKQFRLASEYVQQQLIGYGFDNAVIRTYPADGKTFFGTQKSRPAWDVEFAELWLLKENQTQQGKTIWSRDKRLASWQAMPLSLAQDSLSGEVQAELVDIGSGLSDEDYRGKAVKGKLVLTSSQPGAVVEKAVGELGAVGILSYAPNQKSAWWKEDDRLVRWGHLSSFPQTKSFGFMISLGEARALQDKLNAGEKVILDAKVKAEHFKGEYHLVDAAIEGTDDQVGNHEVLFTCHLDHPRPGANDNASGCVAILEAARTLNKLIKEGVLPKPRRTLRFIWPAEIEGSLIYLSERDDTDNIKANIHMDMVGGNPDTKAVFRISGGPMSTPTFIADVGHALGQFINHQTLAFASGQAAQFPLNSVEGGKEPWLAQMEGISMGSDHQIFNSGSWKIPGLYLHDWPDRYIHTNFDTAANIDPTKLKRAAFFGAINGWYLANLEDSDGEQVLHLLKQNALQRSAAMLQRQGEEGYAATHQVLLQVENDKLQSLKNFMHLNDADVKQSRTFYRSLFALTESRKNKAQQDKSIVYRRNESIKGTMNAFGYSYLDAHISEQDKSKLGLRSYQGFRGRGGEYTYEVLNLVDGERSVQQIHEWLVAEFGPIPYQLVEGYLEVLASIDVLVEQ
jgi:hypothetical protein